MIGMPIKTTDDREIGVPWPVLRGTVTQRSPGRLTHSDLSKSGGLRRAFTTTSPLAHQGPGLPVALPFLTPPVSLE